MSNNAPSLPTARPPTYSRSDFEAILGGMGWDRPGESSFICADDGARVDPTDLTESLAWHPLCEVTRPGGPNPLDEPWLPFPFTAKQLAALMVDGWGYFIREKYGDWNLGPDEAELESIAPLAIKAKEALRAAYEAYRDAEGMPPSYRNDSAGRAKALVEQYNEARE